MIGTILAAVVAHQAAVVLFGLFIASEWMALSPGIKSNGLFQLALGYLKKQPAAQELAQEILK